jgi:hypothetical protein
MMDLILMAAMFLFLSCSSYTVEIRQFGLTEVISVKGEILKIDTLHNEYGGVAKIVTYRRKVDK